LNLRPAGHMVYPFTTRFRPSPFMNYFLRDGPVRHLVMVS
jgi:hypothetical protein